MKVITGQWQDPSGIAIAYGTISLKLNQDATVFGTSQIAPRIIQFGLDQSGSIPAGTQIWCNDELNPSGTYYSLTILEQGGGVIYGPENFTIAGSSPINLNLIVPAGTGSSGGGLSINIQDSVQFITSTQSVGFAGTVNTLILATAGVPGIILTLPSAVGVSGQTMKIVKIDTGAGGVTIATTGGQTISGRSNYVLTNQWQAVDVESNNINWIITSSFG